MNIKQKTNNHTKKYKIASKEREDKKDIHILKKNLEKNYEVY